MSDSRSNLTGSPKKIPRKINSASRVAATVIGIVGVLASLIMILAGLLTLDFAFAIGGLIIFVVMLVFLYVGISGSPRTYLTRWYINDLQDPEWDKDVANGYSTSIKYLRYTKIDLLLLVAMFVFGCATVMLVHKITGVPVYEDAWTQGCAAGVLLGILCAAYMWQTKKGGIPNYVVWGSLLAISILLAIAGYRYHSARWGIYALTMGLSLPLFCGYQVSTYAASLC